MPDGSGNEVYLSDVSTRDKPWDTHRANAGLVEGIYRDAGLLSKADRMQQCSNWLRYAFEAHDLGEFRLRLRESRFCRIRTCPTCQWRRSLMWQARFHQMLPGLLEAYPTARFVFLTLTVRNCPIELLRETITAMNAAWDRLSRRKIFPATGWVKSLEVTRNAQDCTAHPHFHCLLMVPPGYFTGKHYLSQQRWRELWQQSLRVDYLPVVNVKAVKPRAGTGQDDQQALTAAIVETLKYGVKESDLLTDREWLLELTQQLHGVRSIAVGGVMRKFLKSEEPEDLINADESESDPLSEEEENYLIFQWRPLIQRYALKI